MSRSILLILAVSLASLSVSIPTFAQAREGEDACGGDVRRLCRHVRPSDDLILACLQAHRAHLSNGCRTLLESHGQ